MTYEEFKNQMTGKAEAEILDFVNVNSDLFELKQVYYGTYEQLTTDGVAITKIGSANNHQAPARLIGEARFITKENIEARKATENIKAEDFIGKKIWGNEIVNAELKDEAIVITLKNGKTYEFKNFAKLVSLAA
jgi:hypothetical protein|nr:MAG TPA: hypothetical protein [Caudoviricetes sp.]